MLLILKVSILSEQICYFNDEVCILVITSGDFKVTKIREKSN